MTGGPTYVNLFINLMSQCVRDKLQSSDGLYRRPMVLFALDSGLSPVGTPPPTSMSTIYLSPSNLGSSTDAIASRGGRSEEHTSELQSLMRISYAVFCLKKKKYHYHIP